MRRPWHDRIGWKLLAALSTALYGIPLIVGLSHPVVIGPTLILLIGLCFVWLAGQFCYAFRINRVPLLLWRIAAVPVVLITAYSLAHFVGYRLTRLAILPMGLGGTIVTWLEMTLGSAYAIGSVFPLVRLARRKASSSPTEAEVPVEIEATT